MNITELVTQVIKRNAQSPMSTKFQSAPFIRPLIGTSIRKIEFKLEFTEKGNNFRKAIIFIQI